MTDTMTLGQALAISGDGGQPTGQVHPGFDVFGIPHGGYLAALGANAVLRATGQPDVFTSTTHYLRKASVGPMAFDVTAVGTSRRFRTVTATGSQDGQVVLAIMASVGDRTGIDGPAWRSADPPSVPRDRLSPPAGADGLPFDPPNIARRGGLRLHTSTIGFATGATGDEARIQAVMQTDPVDQLAAIVACDLTPPAVWNALGAKGWVPTVELTVHVRARPAAGPLTIDVATNHVAGGFLEEDAVVYDSEGQLVVQSRQLARWTA